MGVRERTQQEHRYQLCRDEYCERFPCRVYKEGHRDGLEEGRRLGYDEGFVAGFSEGMDACPRAHT